MSAADIGDPLSLALMLSMAVILIRLGGLMEEWA
jgi:hypothetical protein